MRPVRSIRNQYRGVNAHLHSLFQAQGGWNSLHNAYISDMVRAMLRQLQPMGYTADLEQSLQISRAVGEERTSQSDITIYDLSAQPEPPATGPGAAAALVIPIMHLLDVEPAEDEFQPALVIYRRGQAASRRGTPVAWVELLSPANKVAGRGAEAYRLKRLDLLRSGLVFVEIDLLQALPGLLPGLPAYAQAGADAYPYAITVFDPRPALRQGQAAVHGFHVDEPLPTVAVPLSGADVLTFDFDAPYQRTFTELFYGDLVDYAELPAQWERYSQGDQTRIARRLLSVLSAAQVGADLEAAPLPLIDAAPLDDLLARLRTLQEAEA